MTKPNKNFELTVQDVEYIEYALRSRMLVVSDDEKREINKVLGKLHNQKNFYRPTKEIYVSG